MGKDKGQPERFKDRVLAAQAEIGFIADKLVEKVWQGDESRRGIAIQAASVAVAAMQDYTASLYMETADKFDGRSLTQTWLNRTRLREARASVALDKGDGETQSFEGARTMLPSEVEARRVQNYLTELRGHWIDADTFVVDDDVAERNIETRDAALKRIVAEDRELLDRLAQKDGDELPDSAPKLAEVAKRERRFERVHERMQKDPVWRKEDSNG